MHSEGGLNMCYQIDLEKYLAKQKKSFLAKCIDALAEAAFNAPWVICATVWGTLTLIALALTALLVFSLFAVPLGLL